MEELVVSELQQITIEIKVLKQQTAQNIIEIGKRLKHAKDSLEHGRYLEWLENEVDFDRSTAAKFVKVAEQFGNVATMPHLNEGKLFALIALPDSVDRQEFIEQPHTVPSTGETKTVDEMTVRELREVKAALKRTEEELATTQEQAESIMKRDRQLREENERLKREKNPEPQVIVETKVVEPDDYGDLKRQVKQQSEQILAHTRHEVQQANCYKVRDSIHDLTRTVGNFLNKVKLNVREYEEDLVSDSELFNTATGAADILREAADYLDSLVQAKTNARKDVVWDAEFADVT